MFTNHLYLIENMTSLHVGSGDTNFGLIDKQIQRDTLTGYPTIHSSSLKGALKEYTTYKCDISTKTPEEKKNFIANIFGDDDNNGKIRFIDAHILSVPFRSDENPYYCCTSPKALEQLLEIADKLGVVIPNADKLHAFVLAKVETALVRTGTPMIEELKASSAEAFDFDALESLIGSPAALVSNKSFDELLKNLPVVARNSLENGESKNLWYEEVLPRKSKFFTAISIPTYLDNNDSSKLTNTFAQFRDYLTDKDTIHIGANASIGYGVTIFKEIGNE
jgi:CRISPR-associated protein Cmr4